MDTSANKILLVEPPFHRLFKRTYSLDRFPLALGYLAGAIRRHSGWQVRAYNADFAGQSEPIEVAHCCGAGFEQYLRGLSDLSGPVWQEVRAALESYRPGVVGITAKSQNFASACNVAALAKQADPSCRVIVGGPHASMIGRDALRCPDIDLVVRGEGEGTIVELLGALQAGTPLDAVRGIVFRRDGAIIETPPRELLADLDALAFPHESADVLQDAGQYPVTAFRSVMATRGCPFNCVFCGSRSIWGRTVRHRGAENVAAELRALQGRGLRFVQFEDDTFGVSREHIRELCEAISRRCPGLAWGCEIHVNLVDEPTIRMMKAAGCYKIQLGIESGNNEMLRLIRKNITIEAALEACRVIRRCGLELVTFFMVGFPQETERTLADTVAAMRQADCDTLVYSIFTPYPGTEAFELCRQGGLVGDDFNPSLYNHQSPANCFCLHIAPGRFRELVGQIETMVDRKNRRNRLGRVFSLRAVRKARELGWAGSFQKLRRALWGK